MSEIKNIVSSSYAFFIKNRHKVIRPLLICILLFALVLGAGYRIVDIKENFDVTNGFEFFVNMASHFWTAPGGYNHDESLKIKEKPDDYVFSRHPKEPARGSFENEKGWAFILSLIIKEGTKGISNIAFTVVRYQLMLDLLVIVLLFFSGKSIAGPLGGVFAAILYALFKPSINMTSWVVYYYWAIPFSALSIFFWTVLYKPEEKRYSLKYSALLFLLYGMTMGLATSVRLGFLFLPVILSPLIFFRERVFKRGLVLLLAMLIGYGMLLMPQILITYKHYDKFALSVRGKWHGVINGLGAYPNPFGVKDMGDLTGVNWAINRGGPDLNKAGMQEYDKFMKKEAITLFKERPDVFLKNIKRNIYDGLMMMPRYRARYIKGPLFFGILKDKKDAFDIRNKISSIFPWLVISSVFVIFFFWRQRFAPMITVVLQGFYLLGVLCIYFPPTDNHITSYFPVFVLLLSVSVATLIKGAMSIPEGMLKCAASGINMKYLPVKAVECFRDDWDKEYSPSKVDDKQKTKYAREWLIPLLGIVVVATTFFLVDKYFENKTKKYLKANNTSIANTILKADENGNFESWGRGDYAPPDGWDFAYEKGGAVHKTTDATKVKIGKLSAEVLASKFGDSKLVFTVSNDKVYYLIGRTITITAWAKSDNKSARKISLLLNNGELSRYLYAYYQNSREWEKLALTYRVPDDITGMAVSLNVDSGADAPAYFDGIELKVE